MDYIMTGEHFEVRSVTISKSKNGGYVVTALTDDLGSMPEQIAAVTNRDDLFDWMSEEFDAPEVEHYSDGVVGD